MTSFRSYKILNFILFFCIFSSCEEESFSPRRVTDNFTAPDVRVSYTSRCAKNTLISPKVDILFLYDNSTSANFIKEETKRSLNNIFNTLAGHFDIRALLSPLILPQGTSVLDRSLFVSSTGENLPQEAINIRREISDVSNQLDFLKSEALEKRGIKRSFELLKFAKEKRIFRDRSYLFAVVISNQDDNSWEKAQLAEIDRTNYIREYKDKILCLRGSYVPSTGTCSNRIDNLQAYNSSQLRFMSIVPHIDSGSCQDISSFDIGATYKKFSREIYNSSYIISDGSSETRHSDQDHRLSLADSYDICNPNEFNGIFAGVNNAINDVVIAHRYKYWPVATSSANPFNTDKIRVFKFNRNNEPIVETEIFDNGNGNPNGFLYRGKRDQGYDLRFYPTPGENFKGYVIELFGEDIINYPECVRVQTQTPWEWFGYMALSTKPLESSIRITINGQTIPKATSESAGSGWSLIKENGGPKYFNSFNLRVVGPSNTANPHEPASSAFERSGYIIKLHKNHIISNNDTTSISYDPSSKS